MPLGDVVNIIAGRLALGPGDVSRLCCRCGASLQVSQRPIDQVPIGELETDTQQSEIPKGGSAEQFRSSSKPQNITGTPGKHRGLGPRQAAAMGHEQAEGAKSVEVPEGTVKRAGGSIASSRSRCVNASAAFERPGDDGSVGSVTARLRPPLRGRSGLLDGYQFLCLKCGASEFMAKEGKDDRLQR